MRNREKREMEKRVKQSGKKPFLGGGVLVLLYWDPPYRYHLTTNTGLGSEPVQITVLPYIVLFHTTRFGNICVCL